MKKLLTLCMALAIISSLTAQSNLLPKTAPFVQGTWVRDLSNTMVIKSMLNNPSTGEVEYYDQPHALYVGDIVYASDGISTILKLNGPGAPSADYSFPSDTIAGMTAGNGNTFYISTYAHGAYTIWTYNTATRTTSAVTSPIGYCKIIGGTSHRIYFGWNALWSLDLSTGTITQPTALQSTWAFVTNIIPTGGDTAYVNVLATNGEDWLYRVVDTTWTKLLIMDGNVTSMTVSGGKIYTRGEAAVHTATSIYQIRNRTTVIYDIADDSVTQCNEGGGTELMIVGTDNILQESMGTALYKYEDNATGIRDISDKSFAPYPNPCNDILTTLSASSLYDLTGSLVATSSNTTLSTAHLASGTYILQDATNTHHTIIVRH